MKLLFILLLAAGINFTTTAQTANPSPQTLKWTTRHSGKTQFMLYLPEGYNTNKTARWPLLLFLHGAGERGTDIQKAFVHGPMKLVKEGRNFPFIIIAPQCPDGERWENDSLLALLDHAEKKFRVDPKRVYLAGISMGGYGTWNLGTTHPERFAAIVPICGGGSLIDIMLVNPKQEAALKSLPVWAFHGAKDPIVPVSESERTVNYLKFKGATEVKLTIYPEAMHDAWTETFKNPEVYDWLLKHERTNTVFK